MAEVNSIRQYHVIDFDKHPHRKHASVSAHPTCSPFSQPPSKDACETFTDRWRRGPRRTPRAHPSLPIPRCSQFSQPPSKFALEAFTDRFPHYSRRKPRAHPSLPIHRCSQFCNPSQLHSADAFVTLTHLSPRGYRRTRQA